MPRRNSGTRRKRPKLPHVVAKLPKDSREMLIRCLAILAAVKADLVHFANPVPSTAELDELLKALADALGAVEKGDAAAQDTLTKADAAVRAGFEMLAKYVQRVIRSGAVTDIAATLSNVMLFLSNVGQRAPKAPLTVTHGPMTGILLLVALAVPKALVYVWEMSADQGTTWTVLPQTPQANTSVSDLMPGKTYWFR
ncbi:MAG: hypothetical protein JOZ69_18710, partial [Myxococcales bacterium]|nr:hypothetical protein [Myxococcales bacterium]